MREHEYSHLRCIALPGPWRVSRAPHRQFAGPFLSSSPCSLLPSEYPSRPAPGGWGTPCPVVIEVPTCSARALPDLPHVRVPKTPTDMRNVRLACSPKQDPYAECCDVHRSHLLDLLGRSCASPSLTSLASIWPHRASLPARRSDAPKRHARPNLSGRCGPCGALVP